MGKKKNHTKKKPGKCSSCKEPVSGHVGRTGRYCAKYFEKSEKPQKSSDSETSDSEMSDKEVEMAGKSTTERRTRNHPPPEQSVSNIHLPDPPRTSVRGRGRGRGRGRRDSTELEPRLPGRSNDTSGLSRGFRRLDDGERGLLGADSR